MLRAIALSIVLAFSNHAQAHELEPDVMLELTPYSVTLSVANIADVSKWYRDVLGFQIENTKEYPEFGTRLAFLRHGAFRVELIQDEKAVAVPIRSDPPSHTGILGASQFAFEVADIDTAYATLQRRGAAFAWELQRYPDLGVAFFFVRDPEGNLIQFIQRLPTETPQ